MAVLLETSRGDIVIDLLVNDAPVTCKNFLKLCKMKYFNNCLFHSVVNNFILQSGDPTGTGKGGSSIYGQMYGDQARFFDDEIKPDLKHRKKGTVGMASGGPNMNASQFYITCRDNVDSLDEKHTIFGHVSEGFDVMDKIGEAFVDESNRPLQNIRIRHTIVLDDPFDDPPELEDLIPEASPEPEFGEGDRLEDDWAPTEDTRPPEEIEMSSRRAEAHHRAVVLEMVGDLPDADAKPPSNMLFICKLNPVTSEEDLEIIFSRFGTVTSCDIIRDAKTGDSLNYGFLGFDNDESCEAAYFKMNNAIIDDRRVRVDFSQSVNHLWKQFKKGGRKGDASMGREAEAHMRDEKVAKDRLGGSSGRLELKSGGGPGGYGGGPRRAPAMLMDHDELLAAAADAGYRAPPGPPSRYPPPARSSGRDEPRAGPPPRDQRDHGDRDRERDRVRERERDREPSSRSGGDRGGGGSGSGRDRDREPREEQDRKERDHRRDRSGVSEREGERSHANKEKSKSKSKDRDRERSLEGEREKGKDRERGQKDRRRSRSRSRSCSRSPRGAKGSRHDRGRDRDYDRRH